MEVREQCVGVESQLSSVVTQVMGIGLKSPDLATCVPAEPSHLPYSVFLCSLCREAVVRRCDGEADKHPYPP